MDYYIFRPTAITWWKDTKISVDIGIVGTECGTIILVNLSNGQQMGTTYVNGSISSLHICQNENNEAAFLLITSKFQQQWRLSLEQYMHNLLHNHENKELHCAVNSNGIIYDNTEESVPNKSKLRELKQLSVEKLAIFKQKLIDTKNQTLGESSQCHGKCMSIFQKCRKPEEILKNSEVIYPCVNFSLIRKKKILFKNIFLNTFIFIKYFFICFKIK